MEKVTGLLREWGLIISMVSGVLVYLLYSWAEPSAAVRAVSADIVAAVQPGLIFLMLFLTFCKIDMKALRPCRWHLWLLLIQGGVFCLLTMILVMLPHGQLRVVLEGFMICMICPTATAAAVITRRLGGDLNQVTAYTIFINLMVAVLVPALLPFVHPTPGITSTVASMMILSKVMPLLIMPLICAIILGKLAPKVHDFVGHMADLAFYIWLVSLSLAIAVTTRSLLHSHSDFFTLAGLFIGSLVACIGQFAIGRSIGSRYGSAVTAGQALGQKNTVLAIWMGYTFFTPVTSIAGGFYSIWHNMVNSWQLYRHDHRRSGESGV